MDNSHIMLNSHNHYSYNCMLPHRLHCLGCTYILLNSHTMFSYFVRIIRALLSKAYSVIYLKYSHIPSDFCAENSDTTGAMKIVRLLNDTYTRLDQLIDPKTNPNVYKVLYYYITMFLLLYYIGKTYT